MIEKAKFVAQNAVQRFKDEGALVKKEFQKHTVTSIVTGLGVVAALAWNDAIQSFIRHFFPLDQNSVLAKFMYALIITAVVVTATVYLTRWFSK